MSHSLATILEERRITPLIPKVYQPRIIL